MSRTVITLWATIDADMDTDSANILGVELCRLVLDNLYSQQVPIGTVTAYAEHE